MGYEHVEYGTYFTRKDAAEALKSGPIIMRGQEKGKSAGHVWTIDGYITYLDQFRFDDSVPMFHCVWGWGGAGNGYYYGFDLSDPEKVDYPFGDGSKPNFTTGLRFWTGFKIRN